VARIIEFNKKRKKVQYYIERMILLKYLKIYRYRFENHVIRSSKSLRRNLNHNEQYTKNFDILTTS